MKPLAGLSGGTRETYQSKSSCSHCLQTLLRPAQTYLLATALTVTPANASAAMNLIEFSTDVEQHDEVYAHRQFMQ